MNTQNNNRSNQNNLLLLGLGALIGGATAYYLINTEKGQKLVKDIRSTADDYSTRATEVTTEYASQVKDMASKNASKMKSKIDDIVDTTKSVAGDLAGSISNKAHELEDKLVSNSKSKLNSLKDGMNEADRIINDSLSN